MVEASEERAVSNLAYQDLHPDIQVIFSNANDGSMAAGGGGDPSQQHIENTKNFLTRHGFPTRRSNIFVTYADDRTYVDIARVDESNAGSEFKADALYTTMADTVITLPVADCIATAIYDPTTRMIGVLHLGRHSSVAGLIEHFVVEVADNVGSDPHDWRVWMSPSLKKSHDRLDYFVSADTEEWSGFVERKSDGIYIDTVGHNQAHFIRAGVRPENIIISPIDTCEDERYFSHRAANELSQPERQGRMMLAVRRPALIAA